MSRKLGFVNICHPDYANDLAVRLGQDAANALAAEGIELLQIEQVLTDHHQAYAAARELLSAELDGVVIFFGAFMLSSTAMALILELSNIPLLIWSVPMFEHEGQLTTTGSYVAFSMFTGTLNRLKIAYEPLIAEPNTDEAKTAIGRFALVAKAHKRLRRTRLGLVGYTAMNIYPGTVDHVLLRYLIGPEIEHFDSYTLINMAEALSVKECQAVIDRFHEHACFSEGVTDQMIERAARIYLATAKLCREQDIHCITIKCQYEFSKEYAMTPCLPLSFLADNGVITSCEGDIPCAVSTAILSYLSGQTATYGDAIHHRGNVLKLSPCGFMPFSLGNPGKKPVVASQYPYFKGLQCSFVMHPGKVTMLRLVEDIGDFHFLYFTGEGLKSELRGGNMPSIDVDLDGDIEQLIKKYPGQHFAICYGDWSREIKMLANLLGIRAETI